MDILSTLPMDAFVTAAFAELLSDVTNLLRAAEQQKPVDKAEVSFWRRQVNALNKAESYWLQGVRLIISDSAYLLPSASRPGALVHRLTRVGGILICSCEAGTKGTLCWHHQLACIVERAAELEALAAKEVAIAGGGSEPTAGNPIPHAAEAATWLASQQQLHARLRATEALLATLRQAQGRRSQDARSQDEPRRLGLRLAQARKKSAFVASAFYLEAA